LIRTRTAAAKAVAIAMGLALVASACGSDDGDETTDTTTAPATTTAGSGETTTTAATEEPAPAGGTATYAAEQEYTAYNNGAADQGLFANTLVLNMTLPGAFLSLPDLSFALWDEMMESAEVTSTSPFTVEYVVKDAAVWSDGDPIDCDDFYLAWLSGNGKAGNQTDASGAEVKDADGNSIPVFNAASNTGYEDIESVDCAEGDKTITTVYAKPFADWKILFSGLLPAHVVETNAGIDSVIGAEGADLQAAGEFWNTGFVGFDPAIAVSGSYYTISEFNPGESLILVRNENFYGTPGNLDEIVFLQVPDPTAQPQALANEDVQVISPQPNPDLLNQLQSLAGVTTSVEQGLTFEHFDINLANPVLADLAVRQAFALCIDRQALVDTLIKPLNPDATVLNNRIFVPSAKYYEDNSGEFGTQDIAKAKSTLEAAGWVLGSDGIYEKDGQKLTFRIGRRDPNPRRQQTVQLVQQQCKEAGMDIVDDPAEDMLSVRLPASDYDVVLFAWVATPALSSNNSIYLPADQGGGQNWNNWSNPQVKVLTDDANSEVEDEARRAGLYNELDQLVWADMVTIPLFQFQELVAYSDSVGGVVFNGPSGVTWNANEWTVA
jgi:peptide/nickel transport system substrate-binding protein